MTDEHTAPVVRLGAGEAWPELVRHIAAFARAQGLPTRDLLVLLPFAQHLALAEAAWAALPDAPWMPRFETTQTLARRSAPPLPPEAGAPSFDPLVDALAVSGALRERLPRATTDDPLRFDAIVRRVVETTHALAYARLALPEPGRSAWTKTARRELPAGGSAESMLAAFALSWSLRAGATPADALHASRPAARVALRLGAVDPAVAAWMASDASTPALWLDADVPLDDAAGWPAAERRLTTCRDFEDEAQRSAAQVLAHLARGEAPVALIALDRVLLRRVRALLDRQAVAIDDESGWMLSTTRAGAAVVALLRAAQPGASADDWLDAMTQGPAAAALGLHGFEAWLRRRGIASLARLEAEAIEARWQPLRQHWLDIARALRADDARPLGEWLQRLREALRRAGLLDLLAEDAAGAQVLDALRFEPGWPAPLAAIELDASAFAGWVRQVLESVAFRPSAAAEAQVVITPLARAALRPFAAVVCPGADAQHLGAPGSPSLLGEATARALGVPTDAQRRDAERRAFAQLLRVPRASFFVRHGEGSERVLPAAPLLELAWAAERAGQPLVAADDTRELRSTAAAPIGRPAPRAPALVPADVSATAYEAMRACPYRYFALRMLGLAQAEELDDAVDAREHGSWLHALLKDFHERRDPAQPGQDEAHLAAAAREAIAALVRDDEDFLPFELAFAAFAPRYLAWLREQEAAGWRVERHEWPLALDAVKLPGAARAMPAWRGRIDRVDAKTVPARGRRMRILDYKASAAAGLKTRVREPLEDTQLAFYAALLSATEGEPPGGLEAAYLALDTNKSPELVPHPQVEASGAALLEGLADDFERLADGATLPALGEARACEHCAARGLCRRDFWPVDEAAPR
ncbi:MAG TPA: PD-(D/E)XK nuclease family protein [Methylibium sp.]|uniref:PD-(D/E)XK nuclease family protein n=1 Tax=Methylibium sp. TaxID=2067992 RepID=UPI002DB89891|nr:PD-(D/E)XK nuclease family protein [Methylibium sp.]HEU4459037.1 PD-(D/E)XK nuclease family protein [Methylibium sp.]